LTSANLHDSQAAVPLMTITSQRVTYLYDLMAAYDAHAIREHAVGLGHKPIMDPVQRHSVVHTKVPIRKNARDTENRDYFRTHPA
jgi:hypothetical protein